MSAQWATRNAHKAPVAIHRLAVQEEVWSQYELDIVVGDGELVVSNLLIVLHTGVHVLD